jgi:hypothetical protein
MLDPKRKLDIAASSRNNFRNYYCALCRRTMNQTLFVTDKAHFGVSYHPDDAQGIRIGDEVVGLFGINFPFILRRNADQTHRMVNVARISGHTWGHGFLGNNVKPKPEPSVDSRSLGSHSRTHAAGASWKDYEQFGMREYAIVWLFVKWDLRHYQASQCVSIVQAFPYHHTLLSFVTERMACSHCIIHQPSCTLQHLKYEGISRTALKKR